MATPRNLFLAAMRPLQAFFALEAASSLALFGCAVAALAWANSPAAGSYQLLFHTPLTVSAGGLAGTFTFEQLVNEGLMALFFFVVGMEIKRELVAGELNTFGKAALPGIAALGGMAAPALIYAAFNATGAGAQGWGIPTATDIAFSVGCLTLLKGRIHAALVVFLTALAIFDDLGGIVVIAVFYGHSLQPWWLLAVLGITLVLIGVGRAGLTNGVVYAFIGVALWLAVHHSGIHASITGVLLGLTIPARGRRRPREVLDELAAHVSQLTRRVEDEELDAASILAIEERLEELEPPLNRFVHLWRPSVAFGIVPLFALANTGVGLGALGAGAFLDPVTLGVMAGLLVGKALGIFGATALAVRLGLAPMPGNAPYRQLFGVAILAGIGFTVALFVASLAFAQSPGLLDRAKLGILTGSAVAALLGYLWLRAVTIPRPRLVAPPPAS